MARREVLPDLPSKGEIPLGTKIRARRWHMGLSLEELARAVGDYDPSHLCHVELRGDPLSYELLCQIARCLQINVSELRQAPYEQVEAWLHTGSPHKKRRSAKRKYPQDRSQLRQLRLIQQQLQTLQTMVEQLIMEARSR